MRASTHPHRFLAPLLVSALSLAILATVWSVLAIEPSSRARPTAATNVEGARLLSRLPAAFVPNVGQWQNRARYVARIGAMKVFLEDKGWTFTLLEPNAHGVAVRMTFVGARTPELVAEDRLPGRHNYFLGNDATKWHTEVPLYRAVRYRELHPGIDMRAREHDGHFEFDMLLQPRADLDHISIAVEGTERMHLGADGALVLETRLGPVRMPAPLSWEEGPSGERSPVQCRYLLLGGDRFGFEATSRRPDWALVVDPGLVYSTFLGGTAFDEARALALDAQGAATVAGFSDSTDFPTMPGAFDATHNGSSDVFVSKISPTGSSLLYSTFLGGAMRDQANALALDAQGAAIVAGLTVSTDFPTTPGAFDTTHNGSGDAFVTKLSPTGSSLVHSTFLGSPGSDDASALVLDAEGAAIVAGYTNSTRFPTTPGAFDTSYSGGGRDAFVTKLSPAGSSLVYSTFLGGGDTDQAEALALDGQGAATVAGGTYSVNFPTTPGSFDTTHNGTQDAFVTRLSPMGSSLVYSTFVGGAFGEFLTDLALDAQGAATVVGTTQSSDFPTTPGAFDTTADGLDAFITRLSSTGSSLVYSTRLGGASSDEAFAVALDAQGAATVAGRTASADFPTTIGAFDTTPNGTQDAFVTRLSPTGSSLVYSTFLGAGTAFALALDARGAATVAGVAEPGFPSTPGAFDTSYNGGFDAFVSRLDMLPTGVVAFGRSSPGCTGPLAISVNSMPRIGNLAFALTCGNAPPSTSGALVLAAAGLTAPIPLLGVEVWLDPSSGFFSGLPASSNSLGASHRTLPLPNNPGLISAEIDAQFIWIGSTAPPCPPLGISTSNALEITIQR